MVDDLWDVLLPIISRDATTLKSLHEKGLAGKVAASSYHGLETTITQKLLRQLGEVVAGEIVEGKRTLIERDGQEFELPPGHSARLTVGLSTPSEGSSFGIRRLEIRDDEVVLHLGEKAGDHGLGSFGNVSSEIHGYPFPSD